MLMELAGDDPTVILNTTDADEAGHLSEELVVQDQSVEVFKGVTVCKPRFAVKKVDDVGGTRRLCEFQDGTRPFIKGDIVFSPAFNYRLKPFVEPALFPPVLFEEPDLL
ncbi:hypothetical protein [Haloferula sp.]|uniref:hypothetical protein n=1 Tax=Haloferula sp. TaxID=2497595 RepID=UPI003C743865